MPNSTNAPAAKGHQVLPAPDAEVDRDRADRGREDQQHQVVDRVRDVEEQGDRAGVAGVGGVGRRRTVRRRAEEAWRRYFTKGGARD
jgi:hypothetical protein